jgi:sulfur relay protein TusB/DsrH
MTTLHLVCSREGFAACQVRCAPDDDILLLQDGVYVFDAPGRTFVLESDARARGVHERLRAHPMVDAAGMVDLTVKNTRVVTWR